MKDITETTKSGVVKLTKRLVRDAFYAKESQRKYTTAVTATM